MRYIVVNFALTDSNVIFENLFLKIIIVFTIDIVHLRLIIKLLKNKASSYLKFSQYQSITSFSPLSISYFGW